MVDLNWMYCLELIKFDVSNTSYYVEVENGAKILGKKCGDAVT